MKEAEGLIVPDGADKNDIPGWALASIHNGGIDAVETAFASLQDAGISGSDALAETVLIEALFQMLERLEANLLDGRVYEVVSKLPPAVADNAINLLLTANSSQGDCQISDLGDGTVLLLGALTAAADRKDNAETFLETAEFSRVAPAFQLAVFVLRCRLLGDEDAVVDRLATRVQDCFDHPELWQALPELLKVYPELAAAFDRRLKGKITGTTPLIALRALCLAASGKAEEALAQIEPIAIEKSLIPIVQGAVFHIRSLLDPEHPASDLGNRFCDIPFKTLDVLDGKSHLCCASWVLPSVGNLADEAWRDVWNSSVAQDIRASIHDGSYRYCNKTACPLIGGNKLPTKDEVAARSDHWREIIENEHVVVSDGPHTVNLAYDKTCNLSCPSCRTKKIAADAEKRARFDTLQEEAILPMLREAKLVFITGAGDPFASKNFRKLMERLGPDDYPDLRFQIMTNGMLFNQREWERFPALHGRVAFLRISLDAAAGPTHELLRRGARWPVMEKNLAFASELRKEGLIDRLDLTFVVQTENYREMGDAVDLTNSYGADSMGFFRLTNWGTFTQAQYADKAVFMPAHPEHQEFLAAMKDTRLQDPVAWLGELEQFVPASITA